MRVASGTPPAAGLVDHGDRRMRDPQNSSAVWVATPSGRHHTAPFFGGGPRTTPREAVFKEGGRLSSGTCVFVLRQPVLGSTQRGVGAIWYKEQGPYQRARAANGGNLRRIGP